MLRYAALISLLAAACASTPPPKKETPMAHVDNPAEHWNLGDLYANDAAWEAAFVAQQQRLAVLGTFRTNLTTSAKTLADGLDLLYAID